MMLFAMTEDRGHYAISNSCAKKKKKGKLPWKGSLKAPSRASKGGVCHHYLCNPITSADSLKGSVTCRNLWLSIWLPASRFLAGCQSSRWVSGHPSQLCLKNISLNEWEPKISKEKVMSYCHGDAEKNCEIWKKMLQKVSSRTIGIDQ